MNYSVKTKVIELFNQKFVLHERYTRDALDLGEAIKDTTATAMTGLFYHAQMISDALKKNYDSLKWYQFFKKRKIKKTVSLNNLINKCSSMQLLELAKEVYRLEGYDEEAIEAIFDVKKKSRKIDQEIRN